jgi:hypothetical protein
MDGNYTLVDGLTDIFVKTFENEGTTFRDELEITDRSTKDKGHIQEYNSIPETTQTMVQRYRDQQTQFKHFDKAQKEKRTTVREAKEDIQVDVYEHLLKNHPETLEDEYTKLDPETGEEVDYRVSVKQSSRTKNIPKAEVKLFIRDAVETTMESLYPKVNIDVSFNKKHCQYILDETFVDQFHENVVAMMKERVDELKSHITYVSLSKQKKNKQKETEYCFDQEVKTLIN